MSRASARRALDDQPLMPLGALELVPAPVTHKTPVRAHRRTVAGPPPLTGRQRRDEALDNLEARKATKAAVAYVRRELVSLYRGRVAQLGDGAYVTADDVETILREWPDCPKEAQPAHGPQHWRGTVFRGKGWRQTGRSVPSDRPHLHATAMPCWVPTDLTLNPTAP